MWKRFTEPRKVRYGGYVVAVAENLNYLESRNRQTTDRVSLRNTCFKNGRIEGHSFSHFEFWQSNFSGATLINVLFNDADLSWTNLESVHASHCNFTKAKLLEANLKGARFNDCCFDQADLAGCDLRGASLENASLEGSSLRGAVFDNLTKLPFSDKIAFELGMIRN